jgi:hypothetical protein
MTKNEWLQVEQQLSSPYGCVELNVDGYRLLLQVRQCKPLKFMIFPYVNGEFKGAWLISECEEQKRFLRPRKVPIYKPAAKKRMTDGLSKSAIKRMWGDRLDETLTTFEWGWPTFGALQRHLVANNKSIELAT